MPLTDRRISKTNITLTSTWNAEILIFISAYTNFFKISLWSVMFSIAPLQPLLWVRSFFARCLFSKSLEVQCVSHIHPHLTMKPTKLDIRKFRKYPWREVSPNYNYYCRYLDTDISHSFNPLPMAVYFSFGNLSLYLRIFWKERLCWMLTSLE